MMGSTMVRNEKQASRARLCLIFGGEGESHRLRQIKHLGRISGLDAYASAYKQRARTRRVGGRVLLVETHSNLPVTADTTERAIAALRLAVEHPEHLDSQNRRLQAALDYLEAALPAAWGVPQFRRGLAMANDSARWQNCKASLAAIESQRCPG